MTITLDPATEERLQRELARGGYNTPAEFIESALDVMEASSKEHEEWKRGFVAELDAQSAAVDRGEFYTAEEAQFLLAQHRAQRNK